MKRYVDFKLDKLQSDSNYTSLYFKEGSKLISGYSLNIDSPVADGSNLNISGIPQISSDAAIQNTNTILYEAANSVILSPGFMVAPTGGAATIFRAEIGGGFIHLKNDLKLSIPRRRKALLFDQYPNLFINLQTTL